MQLKSKFGSLKSATISAVDLRSSEVTLCPSLVSLFTNFLPIKPSPPVTNIFIVCFLI